MRSLYTIRAIGQIVHVDLTPEFVFCLDHLQPLWRDVTRFCGRRRHRRVLIEGHAPQRKMEPPDVYEHGVLVRNLKPTDMRIAFCFHAYEVDKLTQHFESLASTQRRRVRFFSDIETALKWVGI